MGILGENQGLFVCFDVETKHPSERGEIPYYAFPWAHSSITMPGWGDVNLTVFFLCGVTINMTKIQIILANIVLTYSLRSLHTPLQNCTQLPNTVLQCHNKIIIFFKTGNAMDCVRYWFALQSDWYIHVQILPPDQQRGSHIEPMH